MADWCVGTGFGPSVYTGLTLRQRNEFVRAANNQRK